MGKGIPAHVCGSHNPLSPPYPKGEDSEEFLTLRGRPEGDVCFRADVEGHTFKACPKWSGGIREARASHLRRTPLKIRGVRGVMRESRGRQRWGPCRVGARLVLALPAAVYTAL